MENSVSPSEEPLPPQVTSAWRLPSYVVGIGASAGGLESLEKLFQSLPTDTGMSFVVIQHLSPDFKSMMYELLARDTTMAIYRAEDGMALAADHIYLLPPKKEMTVIAGKLHLIDKDPAKGLTLPIDRFFESLAREYGSKAIGMPLSAQGTGVVDLVMEPSEIGHSLLEHAVNPRRARELDLRPYDSGKSKVPLRGMEAIYDRFRDEYDLDFSVYKDATVIRRINRRIELAGLQSIDAYVEKFLADPSELNALYEDLLIGVTQFFRDDEPFDYLRIHLIPELLRRRPVDRVFRVWVSGCATGEEAYSLAILLHEAFLDAGRQPNFKIFATDVHKKSLAHAGRGMFREEALKFVLPERRERYFTRHANVYQISSEIREAIVFAPHNVLRDAPFTDQDFVSCRNLLIYFQSAAQAKALSMFHFGLNTDGILFLGSSESPGELSAEFDTIHEHCKVYRKWRQVRLPAEIRLPIARSTGTTVPVVAIRGFTSPARHPEPGLLSVYDHLLAKYMPPSLLINDRRELIDSFGGAEKLLRIPSRRPSLDVLELLDPSIRTTLMGAIQRCMKSSELVRFAGIKIQLADSQQSYNLTVEPFANQASHATNYLLTFVPVGQPTNIASEEFDSLPSDSEVSNTHMLQVEDELRYTKENLQATIEELETSNEELQATNEELVASNEELQSTNEELHSVNEELYTVNAEHQRKIAELAEVNQDMVHLLENTDLATLFLDSDLRIRKFTSRIRKIFDLLDQDVGRPISSFAHRIRLNGMLERIQEVRRSGDSFETEVHTTEEACYLLRILPYRIRGNIEGIVIVLVDLAPLEDLRGRLRWMSSIVESTSDAIIGEDLNGYITSWNDGAEHLYGYSAEEAIGKHVSILVPKSRMGEVSDYLDQIERGLNVRTIETARLHRDGHEIQISLTVSAVRNAMNQVIGVSKIAHDVTERVQVENALRDQAKQRDLFLAMLSHELRNPLNAVTTAGHFLADDRIATAERAKAVATIQRQSSMMSSLLDDLLDVSRISNGKISLSRTVFNLAELITPIQETTLPEISMHRSKLYFEVQNQDLYVEADRARLIQIHVNLIHNAAKYSPEGSPIYVTIEAEGSMALIKVRDEGAGISADFLPKIFDPFVQSDETLDRAEGGIGVGLTLVKSLVELHNGTIDAFSLGRGFGSTFVVRLPLVRKPERPVGSVVNPVESIRSALPTTGSLPQHHRIVIVEDIQDNREMLQAILELDGHRVTSASDGESGLRAIVQERPSFALIDIGLPGMDGYEVARLVRQDRDCDSVYLIALTGYGRPSDVAKANEVGFDDHLVKPVDLSNLTAIFQSSKRRDRP
jgi:two-component system, chemotaxis family, CheB/CheR fusion protein